MWLLCLISVVGAVACLPVNAGMPTLAALAATPPLQAATRTPDATPAQPTTLPPTPTRTPRPTWTVTPSPTATPLCAGAGRVASGIYTSLVDGPQRRFRVYLPPCYGEDGRVYPVLYLLHGNGQDEGTWDQVGVDEAADAGILARTLPPMIIIMPAGGWAMYYTSGGPGSFESVIMDDLIPAIEADYCAWATPAGRAIGGISRGGYWALEIAFRHPADFAGVGGHSAALLDTYAGPNLNPQYTGVNNALGDLRVYLDAGEGDLGVLPNLERLHEDLENAGIPHEWHLNPGDHSETYWSDQVSNYLAWYAAPWSPDRQQYPPCAQKSQAP